MSVTDTEIIDRIRQGAKHQYAQLVDRYKDKAFSLAVKMLRNRQDAEEAAQDAFIRAYNALDRFEGKSRFGTWFYRILYNVCLTKLAGHRQDFHHFDHVSDLEENGYQAADSSGIAEFETKDLVALVKRTMETLPGKYQTILSLFYIQELSYEEICEVTGLPAGTVKIHLFRARIMLQQRMQKELQYESAI